MRRPLARSFVAVSGAIAVLIGVSILFAPNAFFAMNHIALADDPNLMSEIRAPGGLLMASGVVMICGAIMRSLLRAALLTSAVVFGMYGVSRVVSVVFDGAPSSSLVGALGIELLFGLIAASLIVKLGLAQPKK